MKNNTLVQVIVGLGTVIGFTAQGTTQIPPSPAEAAPRVPAFSVAYMDPTVAPAADFYRFAAGRWLKDNPVPSDKARWAAFIELAERNWYLIHTILNEATADTNSPAHAPRRKVGDFFASAMDTNRIEQLGLQPLVNDLQRVDAVQTVADLVTLQADFHQRGIGGMFSIGFSADEKNSAIYAVQLWQGGLSLPDRDYYLKDSFAEKLRLYRAHVQTMFGLLGETPTKASANAATVVALETELAKASRTRVDLRDPNWNYHKFGHGELVAKTPALLWNVYFTERKVSGPLYEIVGQPEFFEALNRLVEQRPLADWKVYLRWHLLHSSAAYLPAAFDQEHFAFYGKALSGQLEQEPRWKRSAKLLDGTIGEALGQLYVERHFPTEAKARMNELVENLKAVFRDRLSRIPWMTAPTRAQALAKFARFTQKIGYPDKFRDYSALTIRRDDLLGNVRRAAAFESQREIARVGQPVDRSEWGMTPEAVNAYFNPQLNEIVFPAGILQPPFFDLAMDDAVNYGGIGVIIGHEMTHGYDDQGRKYDAEGNLNNWWTAADTQAFDSRAQRIVEEYDAFEALPGMRVNGKLTLGENLADLGGVNIAFEALQRALAQDPAKRKKMDGFTPEQRFFISYAQIWRINIRAAEAQRLITVDPHAPGQFRAYGPLLHMPQFYETFTIPPGSPMWLPPEKRAQVW